MGLWDRVTRCSSSARSNPREKRLFSDRFLSALAAKSEPSVDVLDARRHALQSSLKKLAEGDRRLILSRYQPSASTATVAEALGRSMQGTRKAAASHPGSTAGVRVANPDGGGRCMSILHSPLNELDELTSALCDQEILLGRRRGWKSWPTPRRLPSSTSSSTSGSTPISAGSTRRSGIPCFPLHRRRPTAGRWAVPVAGNVRTPREVVRQTVALDLCLRLALSLLVSSALGWSAITVVWYSLVGLAVGTRHRRMSPG